MTTFASQLGLLDGLKKRDRGERKAADHLRKLNSYAYEMIERDILAFGPGVRFSSEDVLAGLPDSVAASVALAPNAFGSCFSHLAKAGKIKRVGDRISSRPSAQRRRISVWVVV